MHYLYFLTSLHDGKFYIGTTSDLRKRLKEHNEQKSKATASRRPFELIYYEAYKSPRDARIRERRLKQFKNGYRELVKRLSYSIS
ncbi:MAG: GIY-YIG nuclease family protein [Candidatus Sungbacteria bacterium]|nr:GIY-YIG nuclease family protein [Candidatus Sungbacteria bacterium]